MTKVLRCGDMMPGCEYVARAESEDELMQKAAEHVAGGLPSTFSTSSVIPQHRERGRAGSSQSPRVRRLYSSRISSAILILDRRTHALLSFTRVSRATIQG